jgi:hypothetical protein
VRQMAATPCHTERVSYITDVLLITADGEHEAAAQVNQWLEKNADGQQLHLMDLSRSGGSKVMGHDLYAAGFNFLDVFGLAGAIRSAQWQLRTYVVAYFRDESGLIFVMSPAKGDRWTINEGH